MLTSHEKWVASLYTTVVALVIFSPFMYRVTNSLTEMVGITTSVDGCPHPSGLALHLAVFLLLVRGMMSTKLPGLHKD